VNDGILSINIHLEIDQFDLDIKGPVTSINLPNLKMDTTYSELISKIRETANIN
jgi:hypothetical protein